MKCKERWREIQLEWNGIISIDVLSHWNGISLVDLSVDWHGNAMWTVWSESVSGGEENEADR